MHRHCGWGVQAFGFLWLCFSGSAPRMPPERSIGPAGFCQQVDQLCVLQTLSGWSALFLPKFRRVFFENTGDPSYTKIDFEEKTFLCILFDLVVHAFSPLSVVLSRSCSVDEGIGKQHSASKPFVTPTCTFCLALPVFSKGTMCILPHRTDICSHKI